MDPKFQTSFIPKKPIVAGTSKPAGPINLFSLLGTIIFIIAIALAGGSFFYHKLILKQIESDKISLEKAKDAFDPDAINEIVRLDTRLDVSKNIIESHLAVTPFFDFLSSITLKSVRFRDFSFTYLGPDNILVEMKGTAQSYSAVALQSDVLNEQNSLREAVIGDMSLEATGNVSFKVVTKVDSSLLSYKEMINRNSAQRTTSSTTPQ